MFILGSGLDLPFWQFIGNTIVTPNYIRLVDDSQSRRGAVWNTVVRNYKKAC